MSVKAKESNVVAALDIGSNTIRLLVARPAERTLETVLDDSRFVRLGKGVDASGKLDPEREAAALAAIAELVKEARALGVENVRVVATSAVRDASNRQEFVDKARTELDLNIEVLSGEDEARLTYLGATLDMRIEGRVLVSDIGGGSVELISAEGGQVLWDKSLQLGSGRLTELFVHHDPPTDEERQHIGARFQEALRSLPSAAPDTVVFTGGTASHVAYLSGCSTSSCRISLSEVRKVEESVYSLPAAEVASKYAIKPERAEVLPAGVTSLLTIAAFYQTDPIRTTRGGIREGVIIEALQSIGQWPEPTS